MPSPQRRERTTPLKSALAQQTQELLEDDAVEPKIVYQDREVRVPVPYDLAHDEATGAVVIGRFAISRRGLIIDEGVTEAEWLGFADVILHMRDSLALMIGDWLAYGETRYGVTYARFIEFFGLDEQTLYDYRWVCGSVQFSLRKENLFYNHYKAVAKFSYSTVSWNADHLKVGLADDDATIFETATGEPLPPPEPDHLECE